MADRKKLVAGAAAAAVLVLGAGTAVAQQGALSGEDDDAGRDAERAITGSSLDRASKAALDHVGGGKVTETEADDGGAYEVEVTRADGRQVEVHLDRGFGVIGTENEASEDD